MYREASATHLLSAGFGVVMLGFVALSLLTGARAPAVLHVGIYSPVLLGLYLLALKGVHAHERQAMATAATAVAAGPLCAPGEPSGPQRTRQAWRRFGLAALVVLVAGSWLPHVAEGLAQALGVSRSFMGTVFMAVVTTLPEMAVTLGALRMGALDMAIGNLLGSNLFNVLILSVDDTFYVRGPLLAEAAPVHAGTAVTALVMTGLVIIGLVMRPQGQTLRVVSWVSVGLVAAYVVNAALVYLGGT
jgi:cation:H+ antiporter